MSPSLKASRLFSSTKKSISLSILESCGTHVVAVATSPVKDKNSIKTFDCKGLLPLGNLIYDAQKDAYLLDCVDFFCVGTIPVNIVASVEGCPNWIVNMPLSESVIKKFLSSKQKRDLKKFFSVFDDSFLRSYVQMLDPNV